MRIRRESTSVLAADNAAEHGQREPDQHPDDHEQHNGGGGQRLR